MNVTAGTLDILSFGNSSTRHGPTEMTRHKAFFELVVGSQVCQPTSTIGTMKVASFQDFQLLSFATVQISTKRNGILAGTINLLQKESAGARAFAYKLRPPARLWFLAAMVRASEAMAFA